MNQLIFLVVIVLPFIVILGIAAFYYNAYKTYSKAAQYDARSSMNTLKTGFWALVETFAVVSIGELVFSLAWQKILSEELAATFYSGLIGYFIGSIRARTNKSDEQP